MKDDLYEKELQELRNKQMYRQMREVSSPAGRTLSVLGREILAFCSNNYLALANDPIIKEAACKGLMHWGLGTGASRLISGNMSPHESLQNKISKLLGKDASLVLPSGYSVNTALINTLAGKDDIVIIDKLSHASIVDGARNCPATVRSYAHRDISRLKKILNNSNHKRRFVITDSLFSMDGDIAPIKELVELKREYDIILMVDEAHAFGCMGPDGAGLSARMQLLPCIDIITGTLSKALGSAGGFVASSQNTIDYLVNKSRGFIFTTAMPVVNCIAAQKALEIIKDQPQRGRQLLANGNYLREKCSQMNLDIAGSQSHIVPIILGDAERTLKAASILWEEGIWVPAIRPPTVKAGSCRLRVSLMSDHTTEDIDRLLCSLNKIVQILG